MPAERFKKNKNVLHVFPSMHGNTAPSRNFSVINARMIADETTL